MALLDCGICAAFLRNPALGQTVTCGGRAMRAVRPYGSLQSNRLAVAREGCRREWRTAGCVRRRAKELQMSEFDGPGESLDEPVTQLWTGARFGDLGDRLARARGTVEGTKADLPRLGPSWNLDDVVDREPMPSGEPWASRFRFAWRGYDRAAVDQYVAELERELAALQAQSPSASSVVEEIERISDQTAAILRVAYEQAEAAIRRGRAA